MGKGNKKKGGKKKATATNTNNGNESESMIWVDPARVRFQHSKIRPHFSGCGRSVVETLEEIRQGQLQPSELPPIQVIVGPNDEEDGQPWYFSLNNRRLWVLKRCREEGLLAKDSSNNNMIQVRVRQPKSAAEQERYSLSNCALEAKFMAERPTKNNNSKNHTAQQKEQDEDIATANEKDISAEDEGIDDPVLSSTNKLLSISIQQEELDDHSDNDSGDSSDVYRPSNPFSALM